MAEEKSDISADDQDGLVSAAGGQDSVAPGASAVGGGLPAYKPTSGKGRVNPINYVLVVLFAAGIGSVYLLSLRSGRPTASAAEQIAEAEVDAALDQLDAANNEKAEETSAVVDTFYFEAKQRQIPLGNLETNPFIYEAPGQGADLLGTDAKMENLAEIQRREELESRMQAVRGLKLQSVLMGSDGARAMISNNLVAEGQTVNGWTVKSIQPRQVILTCQDREYVLKLPR